MTIIYLHGKVIQVLKITKATKRIKQCAPLSYLPYIRLSEPVSVKVPTFQWRIPFTSLPVSNGVHTAQWWS